MTQTFCACCGVPVALPEIDFCERCDGHVLKHQEGVPYWRATYAAQRDFKVECPFSVADDSSERGGSNE